MHPWRRASRIGKVDLASLDLSTRKRAVPGQAKTTSAGRRGLRAISPHTGEMRVNPLEDSIVLLVSLGVTSAISWDPPPSGTDPVAEGGAWAGPRSMRQRQEMACSWTGSGALGERRIFQGYVAVERVDWSCKKPTGVYK